MITSILLSILLFIYLAVLGIKQGLINALQASTTMLCLTPSAHPWHTLFL